MLDIMLTAGRLACCPRIGPRQMELGLGIHGEPGASKAALQPVDAIVAQVGDPSFSRIILWRSTAPLAVSSRQLLTDSLRKVE